MIFGKVLPPQKRMQSHIVPVNYVIYITVQLLLVNLYTLSNYTAL